jgi:hypothetical protein
MRRALPALRQSSEQGMCARDAEMTRQQHEVKAFRNSVVNMMDVPQEVDNAGA